MKVLTAVLPALALLGSLAPTHAITLTPGTYKLEWNAATEKDSASRRWVPNGIYMAISDYNSYYKTKLKLPKLTSSKPYLSPSPGFIFLLDESQGTGKGYDLLYIKQGLPSNDVDMTDATKVVLLREKGSNILKPASGKDIFVDVKTGAPGSQISRKLKVDVEITLDSAKGAATPVNNMFLITGGWYGTVDTDSGPVEIQTIDETGNGLYNDKISDNRLGWRDSIRLTSPQEDVAYSQRLAEDRGLGKAVLVGNKLYSIDVSDAGDSVTIKPYSGDVCNVTFDMRNGSNKPIVPDFLNFNRPDSELIFRGLTNATVELPADTYKGVWACADYKNANLAIDVSRSIAVSAKMKQPFTIGGPLKMAIVTKTDTAKAGSELYVSFPISAGQDRLAGLQLDKPQGYESPTVSVICTDAKGKKVSSHKTTMPWGYAASCDLTVGKKWKPGKYTITATMNAQPYGGTVTAKKTITVTK